MHRWAKQDIPDVLNFTPWFDAGQNARRHVFLLLYNICDVEDRENKMLVDW